MIAVTNTKVLTRSNKPAKEHRRKVLKEHKGVKFEYEEVYYLDFEVDENTGEVYKDNLVQHYTKDQVDRNLKALKSAFIIVKGGHL